MMLYFTQGRHNIILIGESLGDPDMLNGLKPHENVIKIGFLNHNVSVNYIT